MLTSGDAGTMPFVELKLTWMDIFQVISPIILGKNQTCWTAILKLVQLNKIYCMKNLCRSFILVKSRPLTKGNHVSSADSVEGIVFIFCLPERYFR